MEPLDPTHLDRADMRAALTARDISTVYRLLGKTGLTQRQIAQLTSQSQSEVSEIVAGRQVRDVEVLERIANGLGIPRTWIGLSYGEQEPAKEETTEDEDMKRRALITATTIAALGQVVQGLGEFTESALPTGQPPPSRLNMAHVHTVRTITDQLRSVARYYGEQADLFAAAAKLNTQWIQVPPTETITAASPRDTMGGTPRSLRTRGREFS